NRADAVAAGVQRIHHDHVGPLVCLFLEHLDAAADGLYATARGGQRVGQDATRVRIVVDDHDGRAVRPVDALEDALDDPIERSGLRDDAVAPEVQGSFT